MTTTTAPTTATAEKEALPPWLGWVRLAIGLAQGLAFYLVTDHQDAFRDDVRTALLTTIVFVPVLLVGGLGAFRLTTLAAWIGVATLIAAGLSWYEVSRLGGENSYSGGPQAVYFVVPVLLFVGHHLVEAADEARIVIVGAQPVHG